MRDPQNLHQNVRMTPYPARDVKGGKNSGLPTLSVSRREHIPSALAAMAGLAICPLSYPTS
jgi:hypothetical protein